jgi:hypothetical protein
MLVRLAIAALAATVVIGLLVAALAFLSYRDPGTGAMSGVDNTTVFTAWFARRRSPRNDFERVDDSVIVPLDKAPELLRTCSRESISPIDSYWRPTASVIREIETRLPVVMRSYGPLEPRESYTAQYAGVVSGGRRLVYGSFVSLDRADDRWQDAVIVMCGGGSKAFGVAFDAATKTFGDLEINGSR